MTTIDKLLQSGAHLTLTGAPEGRDALAVADLASTAAERDILVIARDDARMASLAAATKVFAPDLAVSIFPAWDCLPYDRVSPRRDLCATRLRTLSELASRPNGAQSTRRVVVATCNAVIQRVPPATVLAGLSWQLKSGDSLDVAALTAFLQRAGYVRTATVMEPGEYTVRGGIIDIYPPGEDEPVRVDLFGDIVESIRAFDPLTQRSSTRRPSLHLIPASEVQLDDDSIARFRGRYRALFGAVTGDDPLYEAVSAGRHHVGMEHWLPLFHEHLETIFEYLPDAVVLLDHLCDEARSERLQAIDDYYQARVDQATRQSTMAGTDYKPVEPEALFVGASAWTRILAGYSIGSFVPFQVPEATPQIVDLGGRRVRDFAPERQKRDSGLFDAVSKFLGDRLAQGRVVAIVCRSAGSRDRLHALLESHGSNACARVEQWQELAATRGRVAGLLVLGLDHGFETDDTTVLSEEDILGDRLARPPRRNRRAAKFLAEVSNLEAGDLIVHVDHGVGRFEGLVSLDVASAPHDCLKLSYAGGDRLFVPVENIDVLSRFGSGDGVAPLDKLGGAGWQARKSRLKKALRDMAAELMQTAAARVVRYSPVISPPEGLYDQFCARFPYDETDDQKQAIDDCIADLATTKPMDRLICGDVGFGKTEVALRAAFIAAYSGRQVAVVVPTTLLCRQHYQTFRDRFEGLPLEIGQLSRLVGSKEAGAVKEGLAEGRIDIVIGTHTLLANTISFKDLGLLIIDEEQHFGVAQKERLKALKAEVDVLTLTATPIPRTLQLALSGVRDLSLIATPPIDRLAVRTFVMPFDPVVVREAILREQYRGGQTFYICPRIEDLDRVAAELSRIVPEAKVAIAHGRMAARRLEDVMTSFCDGKYDILLSTSIIESGLDIPSANTMVVHRADMFGLAQLYQLRGRVGRSKTRAYAYFTVPPHRLLKGAAEARLNVIQTLDSLGAGFSLASHDLDIRGAGNLLGDAQSGHIREVGIELYQQLLEEAVQAARAEPGADAPGDQWSPQITVGVSVMIPESYVQDLTVRMSLYRRIGNLVVDDEVDSFAAEMVDRFGSLPDETEQLLNVVKIKGLCRVAGIEKIDAGPKGAVISFRDNRFARPEKLIALIADRVHEVKLRPDHKLVVVRNWADPARRLVGVHEFVRELAEMAEPVAA